MTDRDRARLVRRLAMKMLYLLDTRGDSEADAIRADAVAGAFVEDDDAESAPVGDTDAAEAFEMALGAHRNRRQCDTMVREIAPQWPPARQAAIDRAIIRLAHFEMTSGRVNPKIAVNEAVSLAREFGGEHSFAFVNGVLDKVLKQVLAADAAAQAE